MPGGTFSGPSVHRFCLPLPASGIAALAQLYCLCLLSGCSLLVKIDRDQCRQQSDCAKLGLTGACVQGVCALDGPQACDGGASCSAASDSQELSSSQCGPSRACARATETCFKSQCAPTSEVQRFLCSAPAVTGTSVEDGAMAVTMHVQEITSQLPPHGLVATACRTSDLTCANPVATWLDAHDRASGNVVLQLPRGFEGYLQITSAETLPALYVLARPLDAALRVGNIALFAPMTRNMWFDRTGYVPDASKGLVVLQALDCDGEPAAAVHFEESNTDGMQFYVVNSLPNMDSQSTVRDDASDQALGGYLNVTPGARIFSARIGMNGPLLGRFSLNVRANTVTCLDIHP